MSKVIAPVLAAAIAASGMAFVGTEAGAADPYPRDRSVCYKVLYKGYDTYQRLVLDIKKHSPLTKSETAYSVHGKHVLDCDRDYKNDMTTATGTVVVEPHYYDSRYGDSGARLGLDTHGGLYGCKSVVVDCTTAEANPAPSEWPTCALNGYGDYSLKEADINRDVGCNFFQDGRRHY